MKGSNETPAATAQHTGGCVCGALRYRTIGQPVVATICHCRFCQKRLASAFAVLATFPHESVEFTQGEPVECEHRSDESGRWLKMQFCARCGTTVAHTAQLRPGHENHRRDDLRRTGLVQHRPPHLGPIEVAVGRHPSGRGGIREGAAGTAGSQVIPQPAAQLVSPLEPASIFLPVATIVIDFAFTSGLPSRARLPSMRDEVVGLQRVAFPAQAQQRVRAAHLERPIHDGARLLVRHVDVDEDVRVGPLDLRDLAGQRDRLRDVVLRRERVVRVRGQRSCEHARGQREQQRS